MREKIISKDGYIYAVDNWWQKGFEIYSNLGKDPNDPRWNEEVEEILDKPTKTKKSKKQD